MSYGFANLNKIELERPFNLEAGDIVWILWTSYRHGDSARTATPTKVVKVYDDGNILHQRSGFDDKEFAWAKNIFAKSNAVPFRQMSYRTLAITDIEARLNKADLEAANAS